MEKINDDGARPKLDKDEWVIGEMDCKRGFRNLGGFWNLEKRLPWQKEDTSGYLATWLAATLGLYLASIYFYTGPDTAHRKIFYVLTIAPFLVCVMWRPMFLRTLWQSKIVMISTLMSVLAIVSVATGVYEDRWSTLYDAIRFGVLLISLLGLLTFITGADKSLPSFVVACIAVGASTSGAYLVGIYFSEANGFALYERMNAGLGYADHPIRMAEIFAVGSLCGLALWIAARTPLSRWVWGSCAAVSMIPVLLSQSRAASLAVLLAAIAMLLVRQRYRAVGAISSIAAAVIIGAILVDMGQRDFLDPRNVSIRAGIWANAVEVVSERWILGRGWLAQDVAAHPRVDRTEQPHNIYLSVLMLGGVVGLAVFSALLMYGIFLGGRLARHNATYLASFGILLFFAINSISITRWIYENPGLAWLQFWLPLGMLVYGELVERCDLNSNDCEERKRLIRTGGRGGQ